MRRHHIFSILTIRLKESYTQRVGILLSVNLGSVRMRTDPSRLFAKAQALTL